MDQSMQDQIDELVDTLQATVADVEDLRRTVVQYEKKIAGLNEVIAGLMKSATMADVRINKLTIENSIQFGHGNVAFHADSNGMWWGTNTLAEALAGAKSIAILMDGSFYIDGVLQN